MVVRAVVVGIRDAFQMTICPIDTVILDVDGQAIWPENTTLATDDGPNVLTVHPGSHDAGVI